MRAYNSIDFGAYMLQNTVQVILIRSVSNEVDLFNSCYDTIKGWLNGPNSLAGSTFSSRF